MLDYFFINMIVWTCWMGVSLISLLLWIQTISLYSFIIFCSFIFFLYILAPNFLYCFLCLFFFPFVQHFLFIIQYSVNPIQTSYIFIKDQCCYYSLSLKTWQDPRGKSRSLNIPFQQQLVIKKWKNYSYPAGSSELI